MRYLFVIAIIAAVTAATIENQDMGLADLFRDQMEDTSDQDTPGQDTPGQDTPGQDTPGQDIPDDASPGQGTARIIPIIANPRLPVGGASRTGRSNAPGVTPPATGIAGAIAPGAGVVTRTNRQRETSAPGNVDTGRSTQQEVGGESSTETSVAVELAAVHHYNLPLTGKFSFGVFGQRQYKRDPPASPDTVIACPTDYNYCLDTKYSDVGTCMWPSPIEIKECLDDTCASNPANEAIFKQHGEDTYCKEWQKSPEGRVCHWTIDLYCSCPKFDIVYTDARYIASGSAIPRGFARVEPCIYPINYKRKNKHENDAHVGPPQGQPLKGVKLADTSATGKTKSSSISSITTVLATCILLITL